MNNAIKKSNLVNKNIIDNNDIANLKGRKVTFSILIGKTFEEIAEERKSKELMFVQLLENKSSINKNILKETYSSNNIKKNNKENLQENKEIEFEFKGKEIKKINTQNIATTNNKHKSNGLTDIKEVQRQIEKIKLSDKANSNERNIKDINEEYNDIRLKEEPIIKLLQNDSSINTINSAIKSLNESKDNINKVNNNKDVLNFNNDIDNNNSQQNKDEEDFKIENIANTENIKDFKKNITEDIEKDKNQQEEHFKLYETEGEIKEIDIKINQDETDTKGKELERKAMECALKKLNHINNFAELLNKLYYNFQKSLTEYLKFKLLNNLCRIYNEKEENFQVLLNKFKSYQKFIQNKLFLLKLKDIIFVKNKNFKQKLKFQVFLKENALNLFKANLNIIKAQRIKRKNWLKNTFKELKKPLIW